MMLYTSTCDNVPTATEPHATRARKRRAVATDEDAALGGAGSPGPSKRQRTTATAQSTRHLAMAFNIDIDIGAAAGGDTKHAGPATRTRTRTRAARATRRSVPRAATPPTADDFEATVTPLDFYAPASDHLHLRRESPFATPLNFATSPPPGVAMPLDEVQQPAYPNADVDPPLVTVHRHGGEDPERHDLPTGWPPNLDPQLVRLAMRAQKDKDNKPYVAHHELERRGALAAPGTWDPAAPLGLHTPVSGQRGNIALPPIASPPLAEFIAKIDPELLSGAWPPAPAAAHVPFRQPIAASAPQLRRDEPALYEYYRPVDGIPAGDPETDDWVLQWPREPAPPETQDWLAHQPAGTYDPAVLAELAAHVPRTITVEYDIVVKTEEEDELVIKLEEQDEVVVKLEEQDVVLSPPPAALRARFEMGLMTPEFEAVDTALLTAQLVDGVLAHSR